MCVFRDSYIPAFNIYIPHWLDSMKKLRNDNLSWIFIYIPHWLDSMHSQPGPVCSVLSNLHSTLVRFYAQQSAAMLHDVPIYIPHWLDSMVVSNLMFYSANRIYIPHWLDSMLVSATQQLFVEAPFTFHTG